MLGPKKLGSWKNYIIPFIFVSSLFYLQLNKGTSDSLVELNGETMGTSWSLKMPNGDYSIEEIKYGLQPEIETINLEMSTYLPFSTVSKFNEMTSISDGVPLSENFIGLLTAAKEVHDRSFGAFDITIGPLVQAWGFGANKNERPPTEDEIQSQLGQMGMSHIFVKENMLFKVLAETEIDLSAIAKGLAVDVGGQWLESKGVQSYMLEIGGEVRCRGKRSETEEWVIGIESPTSSSSEIHSIIALRDQSMATSGDYKQFYTKDGQHISHTIDPRTGYPVDHNLASVTVIHDSTMMADAWATALSVLGPIDGIEMAKMNQLTVLMLVRNDKDEIITIETDDFFSNRIK